MNIKNDKFYKIQNVGCLQHNRCVQEIMAAPHKKADKKLEKSCKCLFSFDQVM